MTTTYNEQALEALIEKHLTGYTSEMRQGANIVEEEREHYLSGKGYYPGSPSDFDARYALDTRRFWDFLEKTQPKELAKLQNYSDWQLRILERFDRKAKKTAS